MWILPVGKQSQILLWPTEIDSGLQVRNGVWQKLTIWNKICQRKLAIWDSTLTLNPNYPGGRGRNYHPLSENRDLRPVCKLKFVRCGSVEKIQSALSFSDWFWRPDNVREHLFPNKKIEIFVNFRQISQIFNKFSGNELLWKYPGLFRVQNYWKLWRCLS